MKVIEIWRYPVKTMAGEKLQRVEIGPLGFEGDRVVHVEDPRGRVITSRSHPASWAIRDRWARTVKSWWTVVRGTVQRLPLRLWP